MQLIQRLFALWKMYAALDAAFVLADIKMVSLYIVTDAVTSIASVLGMLLLAERFAGIGPWTQPQIIFLLGYATTARGVLDMLFGYNIMMISRRIGRGQFDHTLLQPQPIWMALLTEGFVPISSAASLATGFGLLLWAIATVTLPMTAGWLALFLLNMLASMAIMLAFSFLWGSLAFWSPRSAEEISSSTMSLLSNLKTFPLDGLGPLLLGSLMTVIPVGFVAWFPCRALLGIDRSPMAVWITPLAATILCTLTVLIFRKGLHYYAGTGSQRYSSFGHRR